MAHDDDERMAGGNAGYPRSDYNVTDLSTAIVNTMRYRNEVYTIRRQYIPRRVYPETLCMVNDMNLGGFSAPCCNQIQAEYMLLLDSTDSFCAVARGRTSENPSDKRFTVVVSFSLTRADALSPTAYCHMPNSAYTRLFSHESTAYH